MPETTDRIPVLKTWKLLINGAFPRSESGRTLPLHGHDRALVAHLSHASRKDLRDAVEAARTGFGAWSGATAYLRSQIVYRLAEMLEGRRADLVDGIRATTGATKRAAARIGPTVCEELGPMPILNRSNVLTAMLRTTAERPLF